MADLAGKALTLLRQRYDWELAREHFEKLATAHRDKVDSRVEAFASLYAGEPAAVVVDVVLSKRRRYEKIVVPRAREWLAVHPGMTLTELGQAGPGAIPGLQKHKRAAEAATIQLAAAGLARYCSDTGLPEADGIRHWAQMVELLRYAWCFDPYVGSVRGIGLALFAYLRMLCGADAIKPDVRVAAALKRAGLTFRTDDAAVMLVAEAMANEIGVRRLWFDQLLWYAPGTEEA